MQLETRFGIWLRQRRNALDLTQWELAERVGCSRDTIQKIEIGQRRPSKQVAELLAACLGIAPAERAAFVSWARLGPGSTPATLAAAFSIQHSSSSPLSNLPTPLTSLIGREQEIDAIRGYLLRDDVRLLSLIGPPGVGKTRLGIAAAAAVLGAFEDGVRFVALETITDPSLIPSALADSLELKLASNKSALDAVIAHLREQHILLVLDNFEQVLDAGLQLLELLTACPMIKVLVTSREALHAYGEWRYSVPPLQLPDVNHLSDLTLEGLEGVASIALFTQRARAVKADFALSRDNAEVVAAICTRLDGLPLAIELAATRVGLLSLDEILSGLGSRLRLLRGNLRYLPPRQRTLRGAIDWSYHLLQPSECALFRRMGVFSGGCTREAAEAVCGEPNSLSKDVEPAADFQILEGCRSLLDKSLLKYEPEASRYTMLEGLHEYALEQLRLSGEEQQIRRRHAQYYVALAQAAVPQLYRPEQAKWLRELEAENDNIRAALAWSVQGGPETAEIALRLSGQLGKFWDMRGYASEGRRWLELALENAAGPAPSENGLPADTSTAPAIPAEVRIKALTAAGSLAAIQGERLAARVFHQQALSLAQAADYKPGIGTCLLNLASAAIHLGEHSQGFALYEQALALFREQGDKPAIARTLLNMGFGERQYYGDNTRARALYEQSLALRRELGDQYGIALVLGNLGEMAIDQGDYDQARALLEESRAIRQEIGDERGMAFCLMCLAALESAEHQDAVAADKYRESLGLYRKVGDREGIVLCLERLAKVYAGVGQAERGVRLWGAADALRRALRAPMPPVDCAWYEQAVAQVRTAWGEGAFTRAWAEGCAMTVEQAIAFALSEAG